LIARRPQDLAQYTDSRFGFAREMANVWFTQLQEMTEKGINVDVLKEELKNMTLVGEYIGSQDHQHLVMYSRVSLIFYAIVDNNS
jgi:hypothetical protein